MEYRNEDARCSSFAHIFMLQDALIRPQLPAVTILYFDGKTEQNLPLVCRNSFFRNRTPSAHHPERRRRRRSNSRQQGLRADSSACTKTCSQGRHQLRRTERPPRRRQVGDCVPESLGDGEACKKAVCVLQKRLVQLLVLITGQPSLLLVPMQYLPRRTYLFQK